MFGEVKIRCLSCNKILSDFEATRKFAESEAYVDLCLKCDSTSDFSGLDILVRPDLITEESVEIEDDYIGDEEGDKFIDNFEG